MARRPQEDPALDMTPMIDVVFELIIFFVVTIKSEDVFSKLNVNRPSPNTSSSAPSDDITVTIEIGPAQAGAKRADGTIMFNKRKVGRAELNKNLADIARTSTKTPIIVKCTATSPHKALVDVLDTCYANKLYSVSVFSL